MPVLARVRPGYRAATPRRRDGARTARLGRP
jgi:hypothetical protein